MRVLQLRTLALWISYLKDVFFSWTVLILGFQGDNVLSEMHDRSFSLVWLLRHAEIVWHVNNSQLPGSILYKFHINFESLSKKFRKFERRQRKALGETPDDSFRQSCQRKKKKGLNFLQLLRHGRISIYLTQGSLLRICRSLPECLHDSGDRTHHF